MLMPLRKGGRPPVCICPRKVLDLLIAHQEALKVSQKVANCITCWSTRKQDNVRHISTDPLVPIKVSIDKNGAHKVNNNIVIYNLLIKKKINQIKSQILDYEGNISKQCSSFTTWRRMTCMWSPLVGSWHEVRLHIQLKKKKKALCGKQMRNVLSNNVTKGADANQNALRPNKAQR